MKRHPRNILLTFSWFFALFSPPAFSYQQIQTLLSEQQYEAAYQEALALQAEWEGEPEFDYLFGQAAMETNHVKEAIFAYERILITNPKQMRVRLELARAYFMLQDYVNAKRQFQTVLTGNPPTNVRHNIQRFLDKIAEYEQQQYAIQHSGSLELKLGYDSNINSATADETFFFKPLNANLVLDEESRETSDTFSELSFQHNLTLPLHKRMNLQLGLNFNHKENFDTETYDTITYGISGLLKHQFNHGLLKVPLSIQHFDLNDQRYLRNYQAGLGWLWPLNQYHQLELNGYRSRRSYVDNPNKDSNNLLFSVSWIASNKNNDKVILSNLYIGQDDVDEPSHQHNGKDYAGLRFGFNHTLNTAHSYFLSASYQQSKHESADVADFSTIREDKQYNLLCQYQYKIQSGLNLKVTLSATDNQSNIALYEYDRTVSSVGFSYNY